MTDLFKEDNLNEYLIKRFYNLDFYTIKLYALELKLAHKHKAKNIQKFLEFQIRYLFQYDYEKVLKYAIKHDNVIIFKLFEDTLQLNNEKSINFTSCPRIYTYIIKKYQ